MLRVKIMNKEKFMDVVEEIFPEIDEVLEHQLRKGLEREICIRLYNEFQRASSFIAQTDKEDASAESKKSYTIVKPVLDDCIDRLIGASSKDE